MCIEPVLEHYLDILERRSCKAFHGAVCDAPGTREFIEVRGNQGWGGFGDTFSEDHWQDIEKGFREGKLQVVVSEVRCYTLPELLASLGIEHIDYMIIDVEGFEHGVLSGLHLETPGAFPGVSVLQVEVNDKALPIRQLMARAGFSDPIRIDAMHPDDIYVSKELEPQVRRNLLRTTLACQEQCRKPVFCPSTTWLPDSEKCSETLWE